MNGSTSVRDGFTLIEVLVAFAILGFVVAATNNAFSTGMSNIRISERYATAILLAESRLATIGVESLLTEGESRGNSGQGMAWQSVVRRAHNVDDEASRRRRMALYDVEVTVYWKDGSERRSVSLATVRLGENR